MRNTFKNITKYFGFAVVGIEWLGFTVSLLIARLDWKEPLSQFGYYDSSRPIFAATFILVPVAYYLYMRHLDRYWRHASKYALVSAIAFVIMGLFPYEPGVRSFTIDVHNASVVIAMTFFAIPTAFIGFKKSHQTIAYYSRILFYLLTTITFGSLVARHYGVWVLELQMLSVLLAQSWLVITNILLLQHHEEIAMQHKNKL